MSRQESELIPIEAAGPPAGKALVFAPHPDDEIFGCGGSLMLHRAQGDEVQVIILTDGAAAANASDFASAAAYAELRREESRAAASVLGLPEPVFLSYPDRGLQADEAFIQTLLGILRQEQPQNLYLPSAAEVHPDHLALYESGTEAARRYEAPLSILYYEVGQPLRPYLFTDITACQPLLEKAVACFESQLAVQNYAEQIRGLHAFRSYSLGKKVKYAEAFELVSSTSLKAAKKTEESDMRRGTAKSEDHEGAGNYSADKHQTGMHGLGQTSVFERWPLISVIIRTMDSADLEHALDSVAAQSYPNIEVILVDAAGNGAQPDRKGCGPFPLKYITRRQPLSRPQAANAGLDAVRGRYFSFLDEDDLLLPDALETLAETLAGSESAAVYGTVERVNPSGESEQLYSRTYDAVQLLEENFIPINALLIRSEVLAKGCRFDESFLIYEDWDFLLQLSGLSDFIFVNHRVGIYRNNNVSGVHNDAESLKQSAFQQMIRSKWHTGKTALLLQRKRELTEALREKEAFQTVLEDEITELLTEKNRLMKSREYQTGSRIAAVVGGLLHPGRLFRKKKSDPLEEDLRLLGESALFDEAFYRAQNPVVDATGTDPALHYLRYGGREGRNPSAGFDSRWYLKQYPDLDKHGINPLLHYLKHGRHEGRSICEAGFEPQVFDPGKWLEEKTRELNAFLNSGEEMELASESPQIAVILVLHNKAGFTFACLRSLQQYAGVPLQLILADNASIDATPALLQRVKGADIIRNTENLHFVRACNQALQLVRAPYVLFLNNDTEIHEHALTEALRVFSRYPDCGAVGAKIVNYDGRLQEAGNIIYQDGSCRSYGRGASPEAPEYNFMRSTDYCSGAFLLTPTALIRAHGGFDSRFEPAYYEETDYCMWLWEKGHRVIYNPFVQISHVEFGSGSSHSAIQLQKANQQKFREKHFERLRHHFPTDAAWLLHARFGAGARTHTRTKGSILFVDDRVPHRHLGSGAPRANFILNTLAELGYRVSFLPLMYPQREDRTYCYSDIHPEIEVLSGAGLYGFGDLLQSRQGYFDTIWISRPDNMRRLHTLLRPFADTLRIIYDCEAIFAARNALKERVLKLPATSPTETEQDLLKEELNLSRIADQVIVVSEQDGAVFRQHGIDRLQVLGHALELKAGTQAFGARSGLLFTGNMDFDNSPNADSVIWFVREVFPEIRRQLPDIQLHLAGSCKAASLADLSAEEGVLFHGRLEEPALDTLFGQSRVFVAPTRFAAGIPYKVHHAAAHGLPAVITPLLAGQLGWENEKQALVCEADPQTFAAGVIRLYRDEKLWQQLRAQLIWEIQEKHSPEQYKAKIAAIMEKGTRK